MLLFGHLGITLGVALIVHYVSKPKSHKPAIPSQLILENTNTSDKTNPVPTRFVVDWYVIIASLIGAILPDLIDKPAGHFIFNQVFGNNGRIFSHTLLFGILVLLASAILYLTYKKTWGFYLTLGVFMHLILDSMWQIPRTLFWPIFGLNFPRSLESNWLWGIFHGLWTNPSSYIPELIGLFAIIISLGILIRTGRLVISSPKRHL